MEKDKTQKTATSGIRESGKFTLYPVTFGLLEWLQQTRKNPLIVGGNATLAHAMELCFSFTRPSSEIVSMPPAKMKKQVSEFKCSLSPADFQRIQAHAELELMKFVQTAVSPKKKPAQQQRKPIRR